MSIGGVQARWGPAGKEVYYRTLGGDMMVVPIQLKPELRVGTPQLLFKNNRFGLGTGSWSYDIAPDGRFLMIQSTAESESDVTIWVTTNIMARIKARSSQ